MKRKIYAILMIATTLFLVGCNDSKKDNTNSAIEKAYENIEALQKEMTTSSAEIVKSGECKSEAINNQDVIIELVSWDLGYSGHNLTEGKESLCIKFHITNNRSEQITINDYVHGDVYLDGVEVMSYISDFYGDNTAYKVSWNSGLRSNSETDYYLCIDCGVNDSHKVEVDMVTGNNVLGTFSFDIK